MKVTQQFPDYSAAAIARRSFSKNAYRRTMAKSALMNTKADAEARYYDNEFRKWHFKLAFIIAGLLTILFIFVLSLPQLIHLIQF
jgi:hypothetical protein